MQVQFHETKRKEKIEKGGVPQQVFTPSAPMAKGTMLV